MDELSPQNGPLGCFADGEDADSAEDLRCAQCGTTLLDLYKDGRMGCATCYVTFKSQVHRALIVLHGAYKHIGKSIQSDSGYS